MTDLEWSKAFVNGKLQRVGVRFNDTVQVLVDKLKSVREEACRSAESSKQS